MSHRVAFLSLALRISSADARAVSLAEEVTHLLGLGDCFCFFLFACTFRRLALLFLLTCPLERQGLFFG